MKSISAKIFLCFLTALIIGCAETNRSSGAYTTNPPAPAEEILINNEQFNKPYKILGPVEYTLKSRSSLFSNQLEFREQAIDLLKQQTYAKFGDEVDAIIDTKVEETTTKDFEGKLHITHIQGLAISFLSEPATSGKASTKSFAKRKHKSPKKILIIRKAKPIKKPVERPVPKSAAPKVEEIQITPTEILK